VVAYSEMVQEWLGFTPPEFPGSQWVAPVLGTVVFLYGGWPFLEAPCCPTRPTWSPPRGPGRCRSATWPWATWCLSDRAAALLFWFALGAGTDVAIESAGIVLAADDPRGVLGVLRLSQASYRKMLQNLGWATGYNLVAVPVAAGALAWAGVTLAPAVGAILMSASTIVVALNAQLLRGLDLRAT